jgi:acyl-CoA reductase-like NAD-dependent aldehyde dehydrogenase
MTMQEGQICMATGRHLVDRKIAAACVAAPEFLLIRTPAAPRS